MENSNRTIEFRMWNPIAKKMIYKPERLALKIGEHIDINSIFKDSVPPLNSEKMVWLQSTGLLDCNGKPIFESDIVKQKNVDRLGIIKFGDYMVDGEDYYSNYATAGFYIDYGKNDDDTSYIRGDEVEIIGSIYENPELLKNK